MNTDELILEYLRTNQGWVFNQFLAKEIERSVSTVNAGIRRLERRGMIRRRKKGRAVYISLRQGGTNA